MIPIASLIRSRGYGYQPDPADRRDLPLGALLGAAAPLPAHASVAHPLVTARDQGGSQSCTGQAISQAARLAMLYRGVECPELSALHNYFCGRAEFGAETVDAGSYLRTGMRALMKLGIAPESMWPFSVVRVNRRPSWAAIRAGVKHRGERGYYRIASGDVDGVRRAIAAGYPVVGGWEVDRAFTMNAGDVVIGPPRGEIVGRHAMVLDGYDGNRFSVINSWGLNWRNYGGAEVTEAFVARGIDMWAVAA